jgi:hypothetical protein
MFIPFQRLPIIDHFTCTTTRYIELFEQSVSFKLIVAQSFLIGYSRSPPNLMFTFYKHSLHTRYKCSFRIASRSSSLSFAHSATPRRVGYPFICPNSTLKFPTNPDQFMFDPLELPLTVPFSFSIQFYPDSNLNFQTLSLLKPDGSVESRHVCPIRTCPAHDGQQWFCAGESMPTP